MSDHESFERKRKSSKSEGPRKGEKKTARQDEDEHKKSVTDENEGGKVESEDEEDFFPHNPLVPEILQECLSSIDRTGNALEYSYIRLVTRNRNITDISILEKYINLRFVDIGENRVFDLSPLSHLTYLLSLKADSNRLKKGLTKKMPFIQFVDFSKNFFQVVEGVVHPELEILHLKYNQIRQFPRIEPDELKNLHTLELRGNNLEGITTIALPSLKKLYLAQNQIEFLQGVSSLPQLCLLHLRNNKISTLEGFSKKNSSLSYLNLRDNQISNFDELYKLKPLPALKELIISDNPLTDSNTDEIFVDVLMYYPHLGRINKTHVTNVDRREAKKKLKQITQEAEALKRIEMEEQKRREEEEEAARKKEREEFEKNQEENV